MNRHMQETDHRFGEDMCDFLLAVHDGGTVSSAVSELHAQGVVLMWSAFEVLARDLFVYSLNWAMMGIHLTQVGPETVAQVAHRRMLRHNIWG